MVLSRVECERKLKTLAESEGFSVMEMIEHAATDSVCPGICVDPVCNYTITEIEPDQTAGYCEACGQNTVQSCLVLCGLI